MKINKWERLKFCGLSDMEGEKCKRYYIEIMILPMCFLYSPEKINLSGVWNTLKFCRKYIFSKIFYGNVFFCCENEWDYLPLHRFENADVAKLVDALDLGSSG